jgi:hypothetical protein
MDHSVDVVAFIQLLPFPQTVPRPRLTNGEAAFLEVISPWSRVHISLMSRQVLTLRQILPQRETVFL